MSHSTIPPSGHPSEDHSAQPSDPPAQPSHLGLWLSMIKSYRLVQADLAQKLNAEFGLSLPQFQFLSQLAGFEDGRRMSDLAEALLMTNGNVTGLSARLRDKNWVEVTPLQSDKRVNIVTLTQGGQAEFAKILEVYETWVNALFADVSAEDAAKMRAFLLEIRPKSSAI